MKTIQLVLIALLISNLGYSQSKGINYKALIKDDIGNVLANQSVQVQFSILKGIGLTNVYSESHTPTTDAFGVMAIAIGEGSLISGDFPSIAWGNDDHFLNVQLDTGSGLVDMGTTEFKAVPYALNAASKIDDLTDGKSEFDGTENGSSLFLGIDAGLNDGSANSNNIGIGYNALYSNTIGAQNIAIGYSALLNNTTGNSNNANGYLALFNNTTGGGNMAYGNLALSSNTIGRDNSGFGYLSLFNNVSGNQNNAYGSSALSFNTTGSENNAFGYWALLSNTTGNENTAIGNEALYNNTTGQQNTASGNEALYNNTTGNSNTANGSYALYNNTTGQNNTAYGVTALYSNAEGSYNTAIGAFTLYSNTGLHNSAYGNQALQSNTVGIGNTANGSFAGFNNISGDYNVFLGNNAGYDETGSHKLYIENTDADANSSLIYGEFDTNILRTNGEFQIGNPTLTGFAFPTTDGVTDQVLQTDGNGALSWVDNSSASASGLEALDEGNGIGWRLIGRDPANYGNIGNGAVDLSLSLFPSDVYGASGNYSTTIGYRTIADDPYSTVVGKFNDNTTSSNILFQVGNGILGFVSNALSVHSDGIITAPSFDISEIIDNKALITKEYADANYSGGGTGTEPSGLEALDEGNGIGWRLIGSDPNNYGPIGELAVDLSTSIDPSTTAGATGLASVAIGDGAEASGNGSISIGPFTRALNNNSIAIGGGSTASAISAVAMGYYTTASGDYSTTFGRNTSATAIYATAMGYNTTASGFYSTALGQNTTASGWGSMSNGVLSIASGVHSVAMGQASMAVGSYSFAMGDSSQAEAYVSTAIGRFNVGGGQAGTWSGTDPIFEIGNGTSDVLRTNALTVFQDGNATLAGTLTQNSDKRLKTNITELQYGLNTILQLHPVSYNWKKQPKKTQQSLGLIAQEVQPLIKEIISVGIDKDQTLSLSYTELIPVLIKAIQEQQGTIEDLKARIQALENR